MPAHASQVPATSSALTTSVDGVAETPKVLFGFSVAETSSTTGAKLRIRDGLTVAGPIISTIALAANESVRDWFADEAIAVVNGGIYVEVVSGSIEGAVYWG